MRSKTGSVTRSLFSRVKMVWTACLIEAKETNLPFYLSPIADRGEKIGGFILFPMARNEAQSRLEFELGVPTPFPISIAVMLSAPPLHHCSIYHLKLHVISNFLAWKGCRVLFSAYIWWCIWNLVAKRLILRWMHRHYTLILDRRTYPYVNYPESC